MSRLERAEADRRHLVAALERVHGLLAAYVAGAAPIAPEPPTALDPTAAPDAVVDGAPLALDTLAAAFGLSPFERDVIVLCAGAELDGRFGPLIAAAHGDPARATASFGLALACLPGAHWSALTPDAPLRAWRLVDLAGPGITGATLRLDERVLHVLAGIDHLDERLRGIVTAAPVAPVAAASHQALAARLAVRLARAAGTAQLTGADRETRIALATAASEALGLGLLRIHDGDLPTDAGERFGLARLLAREAILGSALVAVDATADADSRRIASFAEAFAGPLIVCAPEPLPECAGTAPAFELAAAAPAERLALWRALLGSAAARLDGALEAASAQFDLSGEAMQMVAAQVRALPDTDGAAGVVDAGADRGAGADAAFWEACRRAARPRLEGLAQRIEARASWDDLVLPAAPVRTLREIAMHVRQRQRVYEAWGFAEKSARGLGISALFAGPSGTGKTMAGEVLARELELDLYRIDLAGIVSKYVGETEKNLKRLFEAAEGSGAILLFDEADALFGKRSEVRDSHDRYANIEVSYLLQRMEAYRGLAILTSNQKQALDPAFLRRIRFVVQFPFPDASQRAAIWRGIFPSRTPTAPLDYERLAQLDVSGGHIRNIALAGAFRAAEAEERVSMAHLADAAHAEYAKLERQLSDAEGRGWT